MSTNLKCPRCGAPMHKATAWNDGQSEFWYVCDRAPVCNTYYNSFKPLPHQNAVLMDNHKFIGNFGGYGSAKTYATRQLIYKQLFLNPGGLVLVGANVASQYQQTIQKELEADIPKAFVKAYSTQKQYMELYNGCRLIYRPLDDVDKLRSMNLSAWFIIEGSEVDPEAFTQLRSRLRNMAAAVFEGYDEDGVPKYSHFRGKGVVESNPDSGWIRSEILDYSEVIQQHGSAHVKYKPTELASPAFSTHISASDSNIYLPEGYIRDLCHGKPQWWIDRYIYGSFEFANGLCCPKYKDNIVPSFNVPDDWVRLIAHDPGLVDPSAFVNVAIDRRNGIAYAYRDKQYQDLSVPELYQKWCTEVAYDVKATQLYCQPIMDPKMHGRRMFTDKRTLDEMWAEYGVFFQPGHIKVKDRIWRLNAYFSSGRLKIMDNCENLEREFKDYKYKPMKIGQPTKEEPIDKNNHSIDALSWICMMLPEDPSKLYFADYGSSSPENQSKKDELWMFRDNTQYDDIGNIWAGGY